MARTLVHSTEAQRISNANYVSSLDINALVARTLSHTTEEQRISNANYISALNVTAAVARTLNDDNNPTARDANH